MGSLYLCLYILLTSYNLLIFEGKKQEELVILWSVFEGPQSIKDLIKDF